MELTVYHCEIILRDEMMQRFRPKAWPNDHKSATPSPRRERQPHCSKHRTGSSRNSGWRPIEASAAPPPQAAVVKWDGDHRHGRRRAIDLGKFIAEKKPTCRVRTCEGGMIRESGSGPDCVRTHRCYEVIVGVVRSRSILFERAKCDYVLAVSWHGVSITMLGSHPASAQ